MVQQREGTEIQLARFEELKPKTTALIIGDAQYADFHRDYGLFKVAREKGLDLSYILNRMEMLIVPNMQKLITYFRRRSMLIAYSLIHIEMPGATDWPKQVRDFVQEMGVAPCRPGMKEYEVIDELKPQPGDITFTKHGINYFNNTCIADILHMNGITDILFTGFATNGAPGQAAITAVDNGFGAVLVEDAVGAFSPEVHQKWLDVQMLVRIMKTDEIITELDRH